MLARRAENLGDFENIPRRSSKCTRHAPFAHAPHADESAAWHSRAVKTCPLILIAGLPGAGKSTVARRVAEAFDPSLHLHVDGLRAMMVRGHISPDKANGWSNALGDQLLRESEAATALATSYRSNGVAVVVDDVALPPVFHRCYAQAQDMHKVLLMPSVEALLERLAQRRAVYDELFAQQASMLHSMLASRDMSDWTVLDTSNQSVEETVSAVLASLPGQR